MRRLMMVGVALLSVLGGACGKRVQPAEISQNEMDETLSLTRGYFAATDDVGTHVSVMEIGRVCFLSVADPLSMHDATKRFYLSAQKLEKTGWKLDRQSIKIETGTRYWIWATFTKDNVRVEDTQAR